MSDSNERARPPESSQAFKPSNTPSTSGAEPNIEEITAMIVDCAYKLHVEAGPGLLEAVYEVVLARMLADRGLRVRRQAPISIELLGMQFDEGFRADLIVQDAVLIELKSVEHLAPIHGKQVLTYLRLLKMPVGLLINFGSATFKAGVKRIVNRHHDLASSRLRLNQRPTANEPLDQTIDGSS